MKFLGLLAILMMLSVFIAPLGLASASDAAPEAPTEQASLASNCGAPTIWVGAGTRYDNRRYEYTQTDNGITTGIVYSYQKHIWYFPTGWYTNPDRQWCVAPASF